MSQETQITVIGNLTSDPELRFTQSGKPVANFTVASTPRRWDKQQGQSVDGEPLFLRCTVWGDMAQHVTESLTKGARVIAQGNLRQQNWQTDAGEKRSSLALDVQAIGPDLRWQTATVQRAAPAGQQPAPQQQPQQWQQQPTQPQQTDPWAATNQGEPPF